MKGRKICLLAAAAGLGFGSAAPAQAAEIPFGGSVEVCQLPGYYLACSEYRGDFQGNDEIYDVILDPLLNWAVSEGLWDFPNWTKMILIYPDDPETVPKNQQRLWLGITVPEGTEVPEGITIRRIDPGLYAVGRFELAASEFGRAWGYLLGEWIPGHGYIPAEGYSFEIKKNDSDRHPEKKHLVDICVPVRRAE